MPQKVTMAISFVLCYGVLSCNLFKTRTPQEPSQVSSNWIQPASPEDVLQNMITAFHDKNDVLYASSFSEVSFTFEPTAEAQGKYGDTFLGWDKSSEQMYFRTLMESVQENVPVSLEFDSISINPDPPEYQGHILYRLRVPLIGTTGTKNFSGQSELIFVRDQKGLWSIRQWLDKELNESDSTWSDLKGIYKH